MTIDNLVDLYGYFYVYIGREVRVLPGINVFYVGSYIDIVWSYYLIVRIVLY